MSAASRRLFRLISLGPKTTISSSTTIPTATQLRRFNAESLVDDYEERSRIIEGKPGVMTPNSKRTGVIGLKYGMSALWDKWGERVPISVLWLDENIVSQVKTPEKEGIFALQLRGSCEEEGVSCDGGPELGHFRAQGVPMKRKLKEFPVTEDALLLVGTSIGVRHFVPSQYVDVTGITRGKGFQVFKGKKMPGHTGGKQRTVKNVWVYKIDPARNFMWLRGQVPGAAGNFVFSPQKMRTCQNWNLW